jgi:tRNA G26 N,N-dimethylase Trm1
LTCSLRYVIANDLSDAATEVMRKNVEINGFSEIPADPGIPGSKLTPARVVVNEGDAWCRYFETILAPRLIVE